MPRRRIAVRSRFYRLIDRSGPCWVWLGARTAAGYGALNVDGCARPAHRVSWELHLCALPESARIRQRCGERACVRPDHLELDRGARDAIAADRQLWPG